jgi:hypothetical protein
MYICCVPNLKFCKNFFGYRIVFLYADGEARGSASGYIFIKMLKHHALRALFKIFLRPKAKISKCFRILKCDALGHAFRKPCGFKI